MALHILIAEADVNSALMCAQILMGNGHSVETCTDGVQALQAVQGRAAANKAYDAVIASYRLAGFDGVRLFTELHMKNLQPAFALCIQARQLSPEVRTEALKAGCKTFFDYPVPLNELNDFANGVANKQHQSDTPYFGTSKLSGSGTGRIENPSNSYQRQPSGQVPGAYGRQPSGTFNVGHGNQNTNRVRRSVTGSTEEQAPPPPQQQQASMDQFFPATGRVQNPNSQQQQPPTNQVPGMNPQSTQRVRRTTTGSFTEDVAQAQQQAAQQQQQPVQQQQAAPPPPPPPPPQQQAPQVAQVAQPASYQVACAHCGQAFAVQRSNQEYNAACIHCGGLNRIVPLQ